MLNLGDSLCSIIAVVAAVAYDLILTSKWQLGFRVTNGNVGVLSLCVINILISQCFNQS